jgi:hypothetical protein
MVKNTFSGIYKRWSFCFRLDPFVFFLFGDDVGGLAVSEINLCVVGKNSVGAAALPRWSSHKIASINIIVAGSDSYPKSSIPGMV